MKLHLLDMIYAGTCIKKYPIKKKKALGNKLLPKVKDIRSLFHHIILLTLDSRKA